MIKNLFVKLIEKLLEIPLKIFTNAIEILVNKLTMFSVSWACPNKLKPKKEVIIKMLGNFL